jgi:hypothetical protein
MAIHAGFRGRNAGVGGSLHTCVTVPAIDPIVPHVVLVTELYRLISRHKLIRQIRRSRKNQHSRQRKSGKEYQREQTKPGDKIKTAVKNLGHVNFALEG